MSTQPGTVTVVAPDRPDLAEFVAEYGGMLLSCLMRDAGLDRVAAEDALQTAYERALRNQDRPCSVRELVAWVLTVARNAAVDEQRHHVRRVRLVSDLARVGRHRVRDVAEEVVILDHYRAVAADVRSLPQSQRDVFVLRVRDRLTVAQVATLLDMPERTVRYLFTQGRRAVAAAEHRRNRVVSRTASMVGGVGLLRRLRIATVPAAMGVTAVMLVSPPTVVVPVDAREAATSVSQSPGAVALRPPSSTAVAAVAERPTAPSRAPMVRLPVVPERRRVRVEASACAPGVGCVGTTDRKPPPAGRGRGYVYVPSVAGQSERYVYADPPGPDACSYMPTTAYTGCVPASPDPSPSPRPESR